jgi:hypothetical protein
MRKRKTGYIFLTILVITGLAGTISSSISGKERKYALSLMKDTRADVLRSIKGLSEAQLNFKPAPDRWSVKECMYHIAVSENDLWQRMEDAMKSSAGPEEKAAGNITDEQLVKMMEDRSRKAKTSAPLEPVNAPYHSMEEAVNDFKEKRNEHIKYLRATTEDLRNHFVKMPFGTLDCYQVLLMIASHSNRHMQQIEEVKADPAFPKN